MFEEEHNRIVARAKELAREWRRLSHYDRERVGAIRPRLYEHIQRVHEGCIALWEAGDGRTYTPARMDPHDHREDD